MRLIGFAIALCLLLAGCRSTTQPITPPATALASAAPVNTSENCPVGDHPLELTSSGQAREYILHVPAAYRPEEPMALVMGFHGAGSSARDFEIYSDFSFLANIEGFIAVYPQAFGENRFWNTTTGPNNPDIQFVRDLIDDLESRCSIDPNRIYATGHSNGGGMANRLACDLSERVAAIGSVAGAYRWSEACLPRRPIAVLGIHATDDPIIPYNGYQTGMPPMAYGTVDIPIPRWASAWGARNGCDNEPARVDQTDKVTKEEWGNCQQAASVILYTIHGGDHGWPIALEASQVIWDFFVKHPFVQ